MADHSAIEWTDATWNPTTGCSKVSPGCAHCYAERLAPKVFAGQTVPLCLTPSFDLGDAVTRPREFTDVRTHADRLDRPLRWGRPRRVFVNSLSDLFHEDVPDQFIVDVFGIMLLAHWHTFQVLTKRTERMQAFLSRGDHGIIKQMSAMLTGGGISTRPVFNALDVKRRDGVPLRWPPPNVWLGVSVESQHWADERIPLLLQTPSAVRFISAEPLLGPLNFRGWLNPGWVCHACSEYQSVEHEACRQCGATNPFNDTIHGLDWVIVGGESGPGARPFDLAWGRSIVEQCRAAGVPVFVKQLGANPTGRCTPECSFDHDMTFKDRKGGDLTEWPEDLRVREWPTR